MVEIIDNYPYYHIPGDVHHLSQKMDNKIRSGKKLGIGKNIRD
jgi:hypothetical protein